MLLNHVRIDFLVLLTWIDLKKNYLSIEIDRSQNLFVRELNIEIYHSNFVRFLSLILHNKKGE